MSERHALIVANSRYDDPVLRQLVAPPQDAEALARVLRDPTIGGFEVRVILNEPSYKVHQELDAFFANRRRDDLLLLYFGGHGIKDEDGKLYFGTLNTQHGMLRSTAVKASDVNDIMLASRSRRQVLVLDCCHSGAFAKGMTAKGGTNVGTKEQLLGHGRVVLTASDSIQYSYEGEKIEGQGVRSIFTSALVRGLDSGEADLDGDGMISLDELYDYAYERVKEGTPQQTPTKWALDVAGQIIIASNPRPVKPVELPLDLQQSIDSAFVPARLEAVKRLSNLLGAKHKGLAVATYAALRNLAADDSRSVSSAAEECLAAQADVQRLEEDVRRAAEKKEGEAKAEEQRKQERLAAEKAEQERIAEEESKRLARRAMLKRLSVFSVIFLLLGLGSERLIAYLFSFSVGMGLDWLYYIYAGGAGLMTGAIYAFALFGRFPVARWHTVFLGGSWALGWIAMAHSGLDPFVGVLGGAFVLLLVFIKAWRMMSLEEK